jgi:steroid 5-alpha reductase family enzyme
VLVLVLTAVWGLRLGAHIYARNRGQGEDKRYASLLQRNRGSLRVLVRHTGKRLLEEHMARSRGAAYADYVRRTSGFIPRPPR